MSPVSAKITGAKSLARKLLALSKDAQPEVLKALDASGLRIKGDVQNQHYRGDKTGKVYKRGDVEHQASAPGEAPAVDTSSLVTSYDYEVDAQQFLVAVGSNSKYAAAQELGFKQRNLDPRPSLGPAFKRHKKWALQKIIAGMKAAIKRLAGGGK